MEPAEYRISAQCLFVSAYLVELGIAYHDVLYHKRHLGDELPLSVLIFSRPGLRIDVNALFAIILYPFEFLGVLVLVVYAKSYSAVYLRHIHPFGSYAKILLHEIAVKERAADTHGHAAKTYVSLVAHTAHRDSRLCKAQYLFRDVAWYIVIVLILHVFAVYSKSRQSSLRMYRHCSGKIYRARTLRRIESPYGFDSVWVEVYRLRAVAPARRHAQSADYVLSIKELFAPCSFRAAAYRAVEYYDLHRRAVRIK